MDETQVVADCLVVYGVWSGQQINLRKSALSFRRSTLPSTAHSICELLQLSRNDHVFMLLVTKGLNSKFSVRRLKFVLRRGK